MSETVQTEQIRKRFSSISITKAVLVTFFALNRRKSATVQKIKKTGKELEQGAESELGDPTMHSLRLLATSDR